MQRGFIALISVLIIGAMIMGVLLLASTSGLLARSDALDGEFAEQAKTLTEGCIDAALLEVSENYTFIQSDTALSVGSDVCDSVSVQTITNDASSREVRIDATGEYKTSYARVTVIATVQNTTPLISINAWQWH